MDHTLHYLRESLSNYEDHELSTTIYNKLTNNTYQNEKAFVDALDDKEMQYLEKILEREINYAENAQDPLRVEQLKEVYEQIF
ncbi:sporulation protein [Ornithinibacillus halotolerans]|uniref:sporulation protein n=1 Tax=Ornithinibacillus halotolerans TaxID=1274357 RepID=UPI00166F60E7|nr:sporulation protein [Ornithinibacillus halotolerans]